LSRGPVDHAPVFFEAFALPLHDIAGECSGLRYPALKRFDAFHRIIDHGRPKPSRGCGSNSNAEADTSI
jgi:hypothetical protein